MIQLNTCQVAILLTIGTLVLITGMNAQATQWGSWEQCTVYRTKYRTCSPSGAICPGSNNITDSLNYTSCPVLTQSQINTVVSNRQTATTAALQSIANSTSAALANVASTYATSIQTSTGFGYIAGIFLGMLFLVPALMDVHKFYIHMSEKKKREKELKAQNLS